MNIINKKTIIAVLILCLVIGFLLFSNGSVEAQINPLINFTGKVTNTDGTEIADGTYNFSFGLYAAPNGGVAVWSEDLTAATMFSGAISNVSATASSTIYTYSGAGATSTLRLGQYLTNASTSEEALIIDYNIAANTITVASGSPTWSAGQPINNRPHVEGGVIDVNLGSVADLSSIDFNQVLYLEVIFNSETMQPRKIITAVPQAFDSARLGGRSSDEFAALVEDETVTGSWTFADTVSIATSSTDTALTVTQDGSGKVVDFRLGASTTLAVLNDGRIQFGDYYFPASMAGSSAGYVLKIDAFGDLGWANDAAGTGGGSGLWASSTDSLYIYQSNTGMMVVIGNNATTSPFSDILDVTGDAWFDNVKIGDQQQLRFYDADNSNYMALRATGTLASDFILTLPDDVGLSAQALLTDGSGNLYWGAPSSVTYVNPGTTGQMAWYASGGSTLSATSTLFLSSAGYLGIGTATPSSLLTVGATGDGLQIDSAGIVKAGIWQADIIAVAYGGTGTSTFQANSLVYASGDNIIGQILPGSNGEVLIISGNVPSWATSSPATPHDLLSVRHPDTTPDSPVRGDLVTGQGATPTWTRLAIGASGYLLRSDGTDASWSTTTAITALGTVIQGAWQADTIGVAHGGTGMATITSQSLLYASGDNVIGGLTKGDDGNVLSVISGQLAWTASSSASQHTILSVQHADAEATSTIVRGDLFYVDANTKWNRLALGASGYIFYSDGTDAGWSTTTAITALGMITQGVWQADAITNTYIASSSYWNTAYGWGSHAAEGYFATSTGSILEIIYGGTGTNTLNNLITLGAHTQGNYVSSTTGSDTITITGALGQGWVPVFSVTNNAIGPDELVVSGNGSNGQVMVSDGVGGLNWSSTGGAGGQVSYGQQGALTFYPSDGITATGTEGALLYWDDSNQRLGIGTTTLTAALTLGAISSSQFLVNFNGQVTEGEWLGAAIAATRGGTGSTSPSGILAGNGSAIYSIGDNSANWNTAYGWGPHAAEGYFATSTGSVLEVIYGGTGVTSLNNLIALGAHTTGDYIAIATGTGSIMGFGTIGEGATRTFDIIDNSIGADELYVSGDGTNGYVLISDGDGSFSWSSSGGGSGAVRYGAAGSLAFFESGGIIATGTERALLYWDDNNQRFAIGTTTNLTAMLTVGATSSEQFLVNNIGQIIAGTWLADIIDIAHGGTGAANATSARANLDLDEIYKFGVNSTGTTGWLWQSDGDGRGQWVATGTLGLGSGGGDNVSKFVGTTTVSHYPDFATSTLTGYQAANDICDFHFSGSHFCRVYDLLVTIEQNSISSWGGSAWVAEGPPGYTSNSNDCNGWTSSSTAMMGAYWAFDSDGGGMGWLTNCQNQIPLACCAR